MNETHRVILVQKDRYLVRSAYEEFYCVLAGTSSNRSTAISSLTGSHYAAMTTAGGTIPIAVLTKADACPDVEAMEAQPTAMSESIKVVSVSACTGYGMERPSSYLRPGATVALLGSSGAGKSTLVNTLAGRNILRAGAIREKDSKGRHTTTQRQPVEINGVPFIDTPGLRELAMIDAVEGIADTFSDITKFDRPVRVIKLFPPDRARLCHSSRP